ncbi:cytochrome P450 CYP12A2-like [Anticarsia gemmatalis]|uniref:cytochrome P450 CYP12A2-like n=1 Tax=Anticarsia gemmatalis TaxID=129554 RepID=UPI003F77004D
MQSYTLKPVVRLTSFAKEIVRTVAVSGTVEKTEANLKSWKEIPGPSSLPFIGQLRHFLPGGDFENFGAPNEMLKLRDKYGPLIRFDGIFGMEPMIIIVDPETTSVVLRNENWLPVRPGFKTLEYYRKQYKVKKGQKVGITGLISDHGELWKELRSIANPIMLQPRTIKLYCSVLDEVALDMIQRMKDDRDEKNMIQKNFDSEMNLWALESIGTVALGCRLNCFDKNLPADSPQRELIHCVHELFIAASELEFKPSLWRYISTPYFRQTMRMYEKHENVTKFFLNQHKDNLIKNAGQKSDHEKGVLEKLLEINEEFAYIMASDMLFAGVDTAANTMTATLYLLATHQDTQNKLREEILSESPKRPYLKACIKESMRLMPVVSGNIRKTTKDYNLMGYNVPKDMQVVFTHQEMSQLEDQFPRPKEYIPERWTAEKNDPLYYGNAHPFTHMPFGFGARSCIGRRIAELEVETFLARIIENFKVEWIGPPPKVVQTSLNYVKGPYNFVFNDVK